jgi:small subunit ribosomal protein S23
MGKRNFAPARVYKAATQLIEAQLAANTKKSFKSQKPVWYDVIGSIPPGEILTRTQPVQHREISLHKRVRKPSKLFAPQEIFYEEDKLRKGFYGDHPWELARPRIILEQDGKDGQRCDWSRIQQPGRQLDGER